MGETTQFDIAQTTPKIDAPIKQTHTSQENNQPSDVAHQKEVPTTPDSLMDKLAQIFPEAAEIPIDYRLSENKARPHGFFSSETGRALIFRPPDYLTIQAELIHIEKIKVHEATHGALWKSKIGSKFSLSPEQIEALTKHNTPSYWAITDNWLTNSEKQEPTNADLAQKSLQKTQGFVRVIEANPIFGTDPSIRQIAADNYRLGTLKRGRDEIVANTLVCFLANDQLELTPAEMMIYYESCWYSFARDPNIDAAHLLIMLRNAENDSARRQMITQYMETGFQDNEVAGAIEALGMEKVLQLRLPTPSRISWDSLFGLIEQEIFTSYKDRAEPELTWENIWNNVADNSLRSAVEKLKMIGRGPNKNGYIVETVDASVPHELVEDWLKKEKAAERLAKDHGVNLFLKVAQILEPADNPTNQPYIIKQTPDGFTMLISEDTGFPISRIENSRARTFDIARELLAGLVYMREAGYTIRYLDIREIGIGNSGEVRIINPRGLAQKDEFQTETLFQRAFDNAARKVVEATIFLRSGKLIDTDAEPATQIAGRLKWDQELPSFKRLVDKCKDIPLDINGLTKLLKECYELEKFGDQLQPAELQDITKNESEELKAKRLQLYTNEYTRLRSKSKDKSATADDYYRWENLIAIFSRFKDENQTFDDLTLTTDKQRVSFKINKNTDSLEELRRKFLRSPNFVQKNAAGITKETGAGIEEARILWLNKAMSQIPPSQNEELVNNMATVFHNLETRDNNSARSTFLSWTKENGYDLANLPNGLKQIWQEILVSSLASSAIRLIERELDPETFSDTREQIPGFEGKTITEIWFEQIDQLLSDPEITTVIRRHYGFAGLEDITYRNQLKTEKAARQTGLVACIETISKFPTTDQAVYQEARNSLISQIYALSHNGIGDHIFDTIMGALGSSSISLEISAGIYQILEQFYFPDEVKGPSHPHLENSEYIEQVHEWIRSKRSARRSINATANTKSPVDTITTATQLP